MACPSRSRRHTAEAVHPGNSRLGEVVWTGLARWQIRGLRHAALMEKTVGGSTTLALRPHSPPCDTSLNTARPHHRPAGTT